MNFENLRRNLRDLKTYFFYDPAKLKSYDRSFRNFYFIRSEEPYVLVIMESFEDLNVFSEYIGKDKEAVIFKFLPWSHESLEAVRRVQYFYNQHKLLYPKHQVHILCNTLEEKRLLFHVTPHVHFINQNTLLDERLFPPAPSGPRPFDVVYNGRLIWMKRQHLLSALDGRIGLFGDTSLQTEWDYFQVLQKKIPHARMMHFQHQPYVKDITLYDTIPFAPYEELAGRLNQAATGAILSRAEGANYASAEYLLCGLPVVSTPSEGGRDVFFDPRYCRIVPPSAPKIKKAVEELIAMKIEPEFVRQETLKKMQPHRERFREILFRIHRKFRIEIDKEKYWDGVFVNKMLEFGSKFPETFETNIRIREAARIY